MDLVTFTNMSLFRFILHSSVLFDRQADTQLSSLKMKLGWFMNCTCIIHM
jgi:hypothetical protein